VPSGRDAVGHGLAARQVHRGDGTVCLLAVGKMVEAAEEAAAKLAADGIDATVWDVRVVSPHPIPRCSLDAASHGLVVTVEDGIRVGGAGTFLLDAMRSPTSTGRLPPVRILGVPRTYIAQGKPDLILAELGLDGPGIASTVTEGPGRRARADPPG
jgi:1-deoxy-D-xylulose-5-phosphate synthase